MKQTDDRITRMLGAASSLSWPGPDHSDRVDAFLKEKAMSSESRGGFSRTTIALIAAGVLGGGAIAAGVTVQALSQRATIIAEDGTVYDVELAPTPEGAGGTFVTDDGTVYGINMVEDDARKSVTVDIDSARGGESTVIIDGAAPRVLVAPGQQARITMSEVKESARATFIDEDSVEHEVDPSAIEGWTQDEAADDSDD